MRRIMSSGAFVELSTIENDDEDSVDVRYERNVDDILNSLSSELNRFTQTSLDADRSFDDLIRRARTQSKFGTPATTRYDSSEVTKTPQLETPIKPPPQTAPHHARRALVSSPTEPTPVKTPSWKRFSPENSNPTLAQYHREQKYQQHPPPPHHLHHQQQERIDLLSFSPVRDSRILREDDAEDKAESLLERMRETLEIQEARILALEAENNQLRNELARRNSSSVHEFEARRIAPTHDTAFRPSPGTRFVAELSRVMDLDPCVHAPLSQYMDRYLERVRRERGLSTRYYY